MNSFWVARRRYLTRARKALRGYIPKSYRLPIRRAFRASLGAFESLVVGAASVTLKIFPDGVSVRLRERLTLERPLDYEPAVIALRVTTPVEKDVRLRSCEKEPETIEWIETSMKPGDVLYDIGANVGAYALVAASWTQGNATIYAFEPGSATFASLVENVFLNKLEAAVVPFSVALGPETAVATFSYGTLEAGAATHGGLAAGAPREAQVRAQQVAAYRLDDFVRLMALQPPTHIKIDVDGGELGILRGAEATLRSRELEWVLVEVTIPGDEARSVKALLESAGFVLQSDHEHGGGGTHNWIFRRTRAS